MLDIGKYSLKVSPYHLYKRATLRRLLVVFKEMGEEKTIREINSMIDKKWQACKYLTCFLTIKNGDKCYSIYKFSDLLCYENCFWCF